MQLVCKRATPEPAITPRRRPFSGRRGLVCQRSASTRADRIADQVVAETPVDAISSRGLPAFNEMRRLRGRRRQHRATQGGGPRGGHRCRRRCGWDFPQRRSSGAMPNASLSSPVRARLFGVRVHKRRAGATAAAVSVRGPSPSVETCLRARRIQPAPIRRRLIAHELAHTLQQNGTSTTRHPPRYLWQRDATRLAKQASRGRTQTSAPRLMKQLR